MPRVLHLNGRRNFIPAGSFWLPATCLATLHVSAESGRTLGDPIKIMGFGAWGKPGRTRRRAIGRSATWGLLCTQETRRSKAPRTGSLESLPYEPYEEGLFFVPIVVFNDLLELDFSFGIIGNHVAANEILGNIPQMVYLVLFCSQFFRR